MPDSLTSDSDTYVGFDEARELVRGSVSTLPAQRVDLARAGGLVLAEQTTARVDSPSVDASARDGFAVISADLEAGDPQVGVRLSLVGSATAGAPWAGELISGQAVHITTGAPLPAGADAVVMSELCQDSDHDVLVRDRPGAGRNVIPRGNDVRTGDPVAAAEDRITPGLAGLLAAAGIDRVEVVPRPRVALLAVGDEVVAPGQDLGEGQLYASNLAFLDAWLGRLGIARTAAVAPDRRGALAQAIADAFQAGAQAVITSGGAWSSHRDLVLPALEDLGWSRVFHRVRMGPGAGTAFGTLDDRPVFCLPGGPPSSAIGFLELALPGLQQMAGLEGPSLPVVRARLAAAAVGRRPGWTEFAHGRLDRDDQGLTAEPLQTGSRLKRIAAADCLIRIPEGVERIESGDRIDVELLSVR
jgi:molybdopterin molybdotransferase